MRSPVAPRREFAKVKSNMYTSLHTILVSTCLPATTSSLLVRSLLIVGLFSTTSAHAQTISTFTGGSSPSLTLSSNWSSGVAPAAGNSWYISTGSITTLNYDFTDGSFWTNGLTFGTTAGLITIGPGAGSTMTLGGNLVNLSPNTASFASGLTIALTSSLNVVTNGGGGNFSVSSVITGSGLGINKFGNGTLTLSGANTYTGATTVTGGVLALDFTSAQAGTTATGIINASSTLQLRGGTVQVVGAASATTQTFNGVTYGAGASTITASAGAGGLTVGLGSLTHVTGGTLNFNNVSGTTFITSTTNAPTNILGGGVFAGGSDFAASGSGKVATYSGYITQNAQGSWARNQVLQNSAVLTVALASNLTIGGF